MSRAIIAGIWVAFFPRVPEIIVRTGGAAGSLGRAATIAIRYSLVRRQGFQSSSATGGSFRAPENQIIDYRMNQYVRSS